MNAAAFFEGFINKASALGTNPEQLTKLAGILGPLVGAATSKDPSLYRRVSHGQGAENIAELPGTFAGAAAGGLLGGPPGALAGGFIGGNLAGLGGSAFSTGSLDSPAETKQLIQDKLKQIKSKPQEGIQPALTRGELISKVFGGGWLGLLGGGALGGGLGAGLGALTGGSPVDGLAYGSGLGALIGAPIGGYYAGYKRLDPAELHEYKTYLEQELKKGNNHAASKPG